MSVLRTQIWNAYSERKVLERESPHFMWLNIPIFQRQKTADEKKAEKHIFRNKTVITLNLSAG